MSHAPDLVVVSADGDVQVLGEHAKDVLRARPGRYRLLLGLTGLLVLDHDAAGNGPPGAERILLAGEITTGSTLIEILNLIATQRWRGQLQVFSRDAHRVLLLDQGALQYASSNEAGDRLDRVIEEMGVLSTEQLAAVGHLVGSDRRLGQALIERGWLDHDTLFECLRAQMQHIFLSTLMVSEGRYLFSLPDASATAPPITVHLPVASMLLDGVSRIDEMTLYRNRIPSSAARPVLRRPTAVATADALTRSVLGCCDGEHTLGEIARTVGLDEFQCTRIVYQLLEEGILELTAARSPDDAAVRTLVARFEGILRDLFRIAAESGDVTQTREIVAPWLHSSDNVRFVGEGLAEDGHIDVEALLGALRGEPAHDPLEVAHQVLHEVAAFVLYAVTYFVPRDRDVPALRTIPERLGEIVL